MGIAQSMIREMGMDAPPFREVSLRSPSLHSGASIPLAAPATKPSAMANPEVDSKAMRRRFSAEYKRRILHEADQGGPGGIAALLRREGLYSSHLTTWRKQRKSGEIAGLTPRKRGKKPVPRNPLAGEMQRMTRENQRLQKRLKQAEIIIDVQKNSATYWG